MQTANVTRSMTFDLRGAKGTVTFTYGRNEDPPFWGYDLLGLDFDYNVARGFPVIEGRVAFPRRGYAGNVGWIQVVDYSVRRTSGETESVVIAPDVAPQARDANTPYFSFGIEPQLFDAPSFTERDVDWNARAFVTYTPDSLMSRVVEPLCGCYWGYVIEDGVVTPKELRAATVADWGEARDHLVARLPMWTFGGDQWQPSPFNGEG